MSPWTHIVRNHMWQKVREIQVFRVFERGVEKWCKEHINRKETDPISDWRGSKPPRRHGQMTWPDISPKGMLRIQEERENSSRWLIQAPPERTNHSNIYIGLVPHCQGGRVQKETGGVTENTFGEIPRPKENREPFYDGDRPSGVRTGTYPAHMRNLARGSHNIPP